MSANPDFNRIAPLYRWLEYLTLGPLLARTRLAHLGHLPPRARALVLGDGDGRFTARLLATQPALTVDAVDLSAVMLGLLRRNAQRLGRGEAERLTTYERDARIFAPDHVYDLVVTHFFLDCLTGPEAALLVRRLSTRHCRPGCLWLVSEFRIPPGPLAWPARLAIRALYLAFRLLTGLRVTRLPEYRAPLHQAGFRLAASQHHLFGILTSELWQFIAEPALFS